MNDKKILDESKSISEKLRVMGAALFIGILFNYFFIWETIGISAVLFFSAVIGLVLWTMGGQIDLHKGLGWMFLIPGVLLSITYAIYNNEVFRSLNAMFIPLLMTCYILTVRYESIKDIKISFIENIFNRIIPESLEEIPKFFRFAEEILASEKYDKTNATQKNILKGILISLPLLLIIVGLLASADMVFEYYLEDIGKIFTNLNIGKFLMHCIIIILVTLYMFGFLWSFQYEKIEDQKKKTAKNLVLFEPVTIITIICILCIVYLMFTIIQFSYLYGGGILPNGLSYSQYARKGFFELNFVTWINFTIVLLSMKFTKESNPKINKIANISYNLLIFFTFNMLFSANYKMNLYEKAFGFTRLRLFVQAFMLLLGILFVILLLSVWIKKIPMLKLAMIAAMTVYIGLNFINVDKLIAKNNIERYIHTKKIDMNYLESLSCDAIEEIARLRDVEDYKIRAAEHIYNERKKIIDVYDHWYEYNYYKKRILKDF